MKLASFKIAINTALFDEFYGEICEIEPDRKRLSTVY